MSKLNLKNMAGVGGLIFVFLSLVIVGLVPPIPSLASKADEIMLYYETYRDRFLFGNYLAMLAAPPSFFWGAYLTRLIKKAEGSDGWWWMAILGTFVMAHSMGNVLLMFYQWAAWSIGSKTLPELATAISALASHGFAFFLVAQFALCIFASLAILQTKVLSKVSAYLGLFAGVLSLMASLGTIFTQGLLTAGGYVTGAALGIFMLWFFVVSIEMLKK